MATLSEAADLCRALMQTQQICKELGVEAGVQQAHLCVTLTVGKRIGLDVILNQTSDRLLVAVNIDHQMVKLVLAMVEQSSCRGHTPIHGRGDGPQTDER